jgi:hypothetical protein
MVDSQNGGAGSHADGGDPLLAIAGAVRDMWLLGASAFESVLTQGKSGGGGASVSFEPGIEQMLRAVSAFRDLTGANVGVGTGSGQPQDAGKPTEIASLVAQAYVIAAMGGLRYWRKLAQTYGAHQAGILRSLSASATNPNRSEEERRALIDELRAYLREVGDVSLQEARSFQSELEKLAAEVATAAANPEDSPEYRRRWKAKL